MTIDFRNRTWLNSPAQAEALETSLTMTTDQKTDFWRETFYGFMRESGHFLGSLRGTVSPQRYVSKANSVRYTTRLA